MARPRLRNMEEFSAATGLSRPTVSKYFHDPSSVRPSTRARIEAALARYDYRPSFLATNQNRRNPKTVGIIVPLLTDPFFAEVVHRIEVGCVAAGHTAIVLSSHGSPEEEASAIDMMLSLNIGGLILSPLGRASDATRIERLSQDLPLLMLDSRIDSDTAFVAADNGQGIGLITDYLVDTGPPPAYLDMPAVNSTGAERRNAYLAAMQARGQEPIVLENPATGWDFEQQGRAIARDWFARGGFPSAALLCGNDRFAIGVLAEACACGMKVGRHAPLRVAGHDNHPFAAYTCPALTTVEQDYDGLAACAVETILGMMEDGTRRKGEHRLPSRLILRSSA